MAVKNDLAEIERDVGSMSMFLQAGEYELKDLKSNLENLQKLLVDLNELRAQNEYWLDNNEEGSRKYANVEEETGAMDDAEIALAEAEEEFLVMLKAKNPVEYKPTEVICCLDRACEYLTEAMGV